MLYIVSTPIGNLDDITLRALEILRTAQLVVCEERREGSRLLRHYNIDTALVDLNEHTEAERTPDLLSRLERGETLALISDHGTPLLADPGARLVKQAIARQIPVTAAPGASSLLAALVVCGLPMERFRFVGLLPPKHELRRQAVRRLKNEPDTWIVVDAPYRLNALLDDLLQELGPKRSMAVACELTKPAERIWRGTTSEIAAHFSSHPFKGEYVVVVSGQTQ